jgi:hypothetical protein
MIKPTGESFSSTKAVGVGPGPAMAKTVVADRDGPLSFASEKGVEIELPADDK